MSKQIHSKTSKKFKCQQRCYILTIPSQMVRHLVTVLSTSNYLSYHGQWSLIILGLSFSCSWSITNHLLTGFMSLIDKHLGLAIIEITQPSIMIDTPPVLKVNVNLSVDRPSQPANGWKKVMNDEIDWAVVVVNNSSSKSIPLLSSSDQLTNKPWEVLRALLKL